MTFHGEVVTIQSELDIAKARWTARTFARSMGFSGIEPARISTVVNELAQNILLYAQCGQVKIYEVERSNRKGIEIVCQDEGPGIEDVDLALQRSYSTSGNDGAGLPGSRRLMDEFEIYSKAGTGTTVICRKWLH
jgi:serine/threonine-protein kinase RsbT